MGQNLSGQWYPDPVKIPAAQLGPKFYTGNGTTNEPEFFLYDAEHLTAVRNIHPHLLTALAGANNDVVVYAIDPSVTDIRLTLAVAGNNTALSVVVATHDITVNLATDSGGVATTTANALIAALAASVPAAALVGAFLAPGNDGTGVTVALAQTAMVVSPGTTPTLDVMMQNTVNSGGNYYTGTAFTQGAAVAGSEGKLVPAIGLYGRFVVTVGSAAGTPHYVVSVNTVYR